MAVSLLEGLAQLFLVCCILPIVLLIIWIVIIILIIRSKKYKNTLIVLISVVMVIWTIATPIFGFGLVGYSNRTYSHTVDIPPGETWEVSGSMDEGNIIEVEFSSNNPLERVYIAKITKTTNTDCTGYSSAYDETVSSLSTVAQSSTDGQADYKVSEDGNYRVIFYNSYSHAIKTDIYVKFRDRGVENILMGGAILLVVGIVITVGVIIAIKKFKKFEQENFNF